MINVASPSIHTGAALGRDLIDGGRRQNIIRVALLLHAQTWRTSLGLKQHKFLSHLTQRGQCLCKRLDAAQSCQQTCLSGRWPHSATAIHTSLTTFRSHQQHRSAALFKMCLSEKHRTSVGESRIAFSSPSIERQESSWPLLKAFNRDPRGLFRRSAGPQTMTMSLSLPIQRLQGQSLFYRGHPSSYSAREVAAS